MKNWKHHISVAIILVMLFSAGASLAEGSVNSMFAVGTTQAFTEEPVAEADLQSILEAGVSATSAMNAQPWFFAVVTNKEVMQEIGGSMSFGAPKSFEGAPADGNGAPAFDQGTPPANVPAGGDAPAMPAASSSAKASLGDSPVAIIVYMDESGIASTASFDCGLACQNMFLAANALGYGAKIVSSPTMALNGENHDSLCEKLGVDKSLKAMAVLLIGKPDTTVDATTSATTRSPLDDKVSYVK